MTAVTTYGALQRLAGPLRAWNGAGWTALGLGAGAVLLGGWAWAVRLGWLSAPYWVLLAWIMALGAIVLVAWLAWRAHARLSTGRVARQLEERGGWRRGALTSLLDTAAAGTSGALLTQADQIQALDVRQRGSAAIQPIAHSVRVMVLAGLVCLGAGTAAFTSAGPVNGVAAALWHPRRAWEATVAPVRITAGQSLVDRGTGTKDSHAVASCTG
jgi:hypothetical protein